MRKIPISQLNKNLPDFKNSAISKDKLILNWLCAWLKAEFAEGKISPCDVLPPKVEIAKLLNVSSSTVQNAIRYGEDLGHFQSKQRVGTCVLNLMEKKENKFEKANSKKDVAKLEVKKLILNLGLEIGSKLPSSRTIAAEIGTSHNTVRLALESLVMDEILVQKFYKKREKSWFLNSEINLTQVEKKFTNSKGVTNDTLPKKLENLIKNYIINNFKIGDKIPTNAQLAVIFNVSLKTVNDTMKILQKTGLVHSRRGQYGTIFLGKHIGGEKHEKSIFMSGHKKEQAGTNFQYSWEKIVGQIKKYIEKNCEIGDKTPSIKEFATLFSTSTNTIRHAISELCEVGILHTQRGKFGGTYVTALPEETQETYAWLALNPKIN